jgi:two-component system sensor histidine kinase HydH
LATFADANFSSLLYYVVMENSFAKKLKTLLVVALIVNTLIIAAQAINTASTIRNAKNSLLLVGNTVLSSFEGGRRAFMLLRPENNTRFRSFLESIGADSGVKGVYLMSKEGEVLLKTADISIPSLKDFEHHQDILRTSEGIFMHKHLRPFQMHMMGQRRGQGRNSQFRNSSTELIAGVLLDDTRLTKATRNQIIFLLGVISLQLLIFAVFWFTTRLMKSYSEQSKRLELSEREAEMGKMSLVMAHELKNPLSSVKGLMEYSAKKSEGSLKDVSERCVDEIGRLDKIVNEFLAYGKDINLNISDTETAPIVDHSVKLLELDAESKGIDINVQGGSAIIKADSEKMKQVIFNLLLNAIQASPEESEINIIMNPESIKISNRVNDPKFEIEKVGSPFYTTKTVGTGLGLAIVKRIVQLHGFNINISYDDTFNVEIKFS